jgi:thiamine pyrophosphate-dependent acetolactate synthase large subunit-like protein
MNVIDKVQETTAAVLKLERRSTISRLLQGRGDALVVSGLGNPTYDVYAAGDTASNFYLWGAMGGAAMLGLGLALAQPSRRVVVCTGDGEMLMGLGSLATIAVRRPPNLALVVIDNEHYGETGMQSTHTAQGVDLAGMAQAAGFDVAMTVRSDAELTRLQRRLFDNMGLVFAAIKVSTEPVPFALPPVDGPYLQRRFRDALLNPQSYSNVAGAGRPARPA